MYRQGDVLITPTKDPIPQGAKKREDGVLARGEATGHAHRVDPAQAQIYDEKGAVYLQVLAPTEVVHEEHGPISLMPGTYKVSYQREYDGTDWRWVKD